MGNACDVCCESRNNAIGDTEVPPAKKGDALKDTSTPWEAHAVTEELAEAQRLAEAETISEFLDALNPGWAILYSAAFEDKGVMNVEDLRCLCDKTQIEAIGAALIAAGAKELDLVKIRYGMDTLQRAADLAQARCVVRQSRGRVSTFVEAGSSQDLSRPHSGTVQ